MNGKMLWFSSLSRSYKISQNTKAHHSAHAVRNTPSVLTGDSRDSMAYTFNIQSQSQWGGGLQVLFKDISFPNTGMYFPINALSVAFPVHFLKIYSSL